MPLLKSIRSESRSRISILACSIFPAKSKVRLSCCAGNWERNRLHTGTARRKVSLAASPSTSASPKPSGRTRGFPGASHSLATGVGCGDQPRKLFCRDPVDFFLHGAFVSEAAPLQDCLAVLDHLRMAA